jgi:uncharacterized membrane protein YozB (DUF420 family)
MEARSHARPWLIPAGLILLGVLPLIGGVMRLTELASGEVTAGNLRFFAAPLPIVLHVIGSVVYFILGAFQFSPSWRARKPDWHRIAGRILIPCGLISALTGVWMAWTYPPLFGDGTAAAVIRSVVGACIVLFIGAGYAAICRREIAAHRAWMIRAYALAIAAGTQPLTLAPIVIVPQLYGEAGYTLGLAAGWVLNLAVAELLIQRRPVGVD